jgi:hypothetical protein
MYYEDCIQELGTSNHVHKEIVSQAGEVGITDSTLRLWSRTIKREWKKSNIVAKDDLSSALKSFTETLFAEVQEVKDQISELSGKVDRVSI